MERYLTDWLEIKAENTRRMYRQAWRDWCRFEASPGQPTPAKCMGYLTSLKARGLSDATQKLYIDALASMYQYLIDIEILDRNPFAAARRQKPKRQHRQVRPTKLIAFGDVLKIINSPDPRAKKGIRDRAMLALFFGCGLRRSELLWLDVDHVMTTSAGTIYLEIRQAKAGFVQQQPIPEFAWSYFSELVSQRKSELEQSQDRALFVRYSTAGTPGKRLSVASIYRAYKHYCALYGYAAAPHSARATAISKMLDSGVSHKEVMRFSRHKSIVMVDYYDRRHIQKDFAASKGLRY